MEKSNKRAIITFKIKTGFYLQLLTPKKMKLLGSIKCEIARDKNGEHVYLEITEIVLIHCNFLIIVIIKFQEFLVHLLLINRLVNY